MDLSKITTTQTTAHVSMGAGLVRLKEEYRRPYRGEPARGKPSDPAGPVVCGRIFTATTGFVNNASFILAASLIVSASPGAEELAAIFRAGLVASLAVATVTNAGNGDLLMPAGVSLGGTLVTAEAAVVRGGESRAIAIKSTLSDTTAAHDVIWALNIGDTLLLSPTMGLTGTARVTAIADVGKQLPVYPVSGPNAEASFATWVHRAGDAPFRDPFDTAGPGGPGQGCGPAAALMNALRTYARAGYGVISGTPIQLPAAEWQWTMQVG